MSAVVGGSLAVAGQAATVAPLSTATGDTVLRLSFAAPPGGPFEDVVAVGGPSVAPVAPSAVSSDAVIGAPVAEVADVVKGADLAAAAAEQARIAEEQAAAETAAREQAASAPAAAGGVQLVVGRVTSAFGARWGSLHRGLDVAAPIGTPIRVPLDGVVVDSGPAGGFGLWVRVRHDDGTMTVYGHINRSMVSVGQRVSAGEVIAEVGNRGQSTGPHLHFEVVPSGGAQIDPRPWLDQRGIGYS